MWGPTPLLNPLKGPHTGAPQSHQGYPLEKPRGNLNSNGKDAKGNKGDNPKANPKEKPGKKGPH